MKNRRILALCMAGLMTVQLSGAAFADGETITEGVTVVESDPGNTVTVTPGNNPAIEVNGVEVTVNASVENSSGTDAVSVTGDADVLVVGDVSGNGANGIGVHANGSMTDVEVRGNVSGTDTGVKAEGDVWVLVTEDVTGNNGYGVDASGGSAVGVYGNVNGAFDGVKASGKDTEAVVYGNVTGTSVGVETADGATVHVQNKVNGEIGVYSVSGSSTINAGSVEGSRTGVVTAGSTTDLTVNSNVTGTTQGVAASHGSSVTVNGNATGTSEYGGDGVFADGDGTKVTVTGNASGTGSGVEAINNSEVTVNGDVTGGEKGISASDGSTVTVNGNVTGNGQYADGIVAQGSGTTVTVTGNVSSFIGVEVQGDEALVTVRGNINGDSIGVNASGGSEIGVLGNVNGGYDGVIALGDNTEIGIVGNVTGKEYGIIDIDGADVNVYGTVTGDNAALLVNTSASNADEMDIPTIIVETLISANSLIDVSGANITEENKAAMIEKVAQQIQYIVVNEGVSVTGATMLAEGYETAKESETLTVTGDVDEGASFGQYAKWARNEDGSYTVTVMRGGDLVFKAKVYQAEASAPVVQEIYYGPVIRATGNQTAAEQPVVELGVRASHFLKVVMDGTDLDPAEYVVAAERHGLLNFQFTPEFISALKAGVYKLQIKTTDGTYNLCLTVNEDGTYTVSL